MINRETIDKIMDTARIEEVVGDFVHLKKRGTSLIGNCPFHGEKTPSFHVSVTKGIYKCFGCGKGGDSVRFIMDHEKYSYPEALKFLANKYNIEVEEAELSPQDAEAQSAKESLYVVSQYAAAFFVKQLWETDEGRGIGLSYFKERGFREDILKKFEVGYSPDVWDAMTQSATNAGHKLEFLEATGLSIKNDNGKIYDRFRGRVMFPIHNFTGRIIGFGGRTLKTDKNVPKYVNSPESEIYHKSNVLYGLFHAKKAIRDLDNCYLAEGYADVLSVHQAGIENVVASSGTSLTVEQIKLIGRFTQNITILFDGDAAGIKASLRGLDMILEEGLNVKIVSFPDGHDPDSYMHHVGAGAFKTYLEENRKDFILYKANVLLKDAGNDPIKRAGIIRDIVESIAKIPDPIKASVFIRECSSLLEIDEHILLSELNKMRSAKLKKSFDNNQRAAPSSSPKQYSSGAPEPLGPPDDLWDDSVGPSEQQAVDDDEPQEKEILRLMLAYGHMLVTWDQNEDLYIGSFILQNLTDVVFKRSLHDKIIKLYWEKAEKGRLPTEKDFTQNSDREISDLAITLSTSKYQLSENWLNRHLIYVKDESMDLKKTILGGIYHLKKNKIQVIKQGILSELKNEKDSSKQEDLMIRYSNIKRIEKIIADFMGAIIVE
ncbi:DNA primase [Pedobacter sp. MR2016-19]|uniref:DNA primase n=1 Tax=Pedobacter sp. MR2016-19 TaxID=2780089 RepID=UPI001873C50E|nr:DNA primase [Pedobacter sp. MR2016-19]MBE5319585.1 DNA primase [Pedobacter sp. MR2016-19]